MQTPLVGVPGIGGREITMEDQDRQKIAETNFWWVKSFEDQERKHSFGYLSFLRNGWMRIGWDPEMNYFDVRNKGLPSRQQILDWVEDDSLGIPRLHKTGTNATSLIQWKEFFNEMKVGDNILLAHRYPRQFGRPMEYVIGTVLSDVEWVSVNPQKFRKNRSKYAWNWPWVLQECEKITSISVRKVDWHSIGPYSSLSTRVIKSGLTAVPALMGTKTLGRIGVSNPAIKYELFKYAKPFDAKEHAQMLKGLQRDPGPIKSKKRGQTSLEHINLEDGDDEDGDGTSNRNTRKRKRRAPSTRTRRSTRVKKEKEKEEEEEDDGENEAQEEQATNQEEEEEDSDESPVRLKRVKKEKQDNEEEEEEEEDVSNEKEEEEEEEEEHEEKTIKKVKIKKEKKKKIKGGALALFEVVACRPYPAPSDEHQFWLGQVQQAMTTLDRPVKIRWAVEATTTTKTSSSSSSAATLITTRERKRIEEAYGKGCRIYRSEMVEQELVSPRRILTRAVQVYCWWQSMGSNHDALFILPEQELNRIKEAL